MHMTRTVKFPPLISKALRVLGVLAALLLVAVLYVAFIGISIDASGQRGKIAALLAESLGREVRFEGPLQLEVSAHPKLRMGGLHIANAAGFSGDEFASMGEARLALNLWALLRMRLQIEELVGSDVHVRLQMNKKGGSNWTFASGKKPEATQPAAEPASGMAAGDMLALLDIKRVALEKLDVEFIGANAQSHFFELQSLVAHLPAGQPLTLALNGTVEKKYPYKLDLTGGSIADLARMDKPWPLDLKLGFMSSHLALNGTVSGSSGALNFGVGTENLAEFEQLLQTKLPAVGITSIVGEINYAPGKVALKNLSGIMGKTTLSGALDVDYGGERPSLRGELALPTLDLRPFMTGQPAAENDVPPKSLAAVYRELAKATFSLKALNSADADLTLRVGEWLSLPGAVHDAMLQVKLAHGRLTIPMQVTVANVALAGQASVDGGANPPRLKLALGTHDSSLGNLAGLLLGMPDVQGDLRRLDVRIEARGDSGAELMESLDVRVDVEGGKLSYGNAEGGRPVQFSLDDFELVLPAGKALHGSTRGTLLDKTFSASLRGATLTDLMQQAHAPVDFELQAGSARMQVHALLQPDEEDAGSQVSFELAAPHSGEIASWLGLKPGADAPVNVRGNFHTDNEGWHLSGFAAQLGRSAVAVEAQQSRVQGKPLTKLQLSSELIDAVELQSLLPESKPKASAAKPAAVSMIDIPILPNGISLADADIDVDIKRIVSASPLAVRDVKFDASIRDGMMPGAPFAANVAEHDFSGAIMFDLRTQQPHLTLWLAADKLDIGGIMDKLGIAKDLDAGVDHLSLQLDLHSSKLGQLLAQSELGLYFEGGHFTLRDANTGGKMRIALDRGELKSAAGAAVHLDLTGSFDNVPLAINIKTAKAADLINPELPIPFKFNASTDGASLQLEGDIDRPFASQDIELALDMRGSRLDKLNALAHTALPPWGPWSAAGKFHMTSSGYEVSALQLQVGGSQLTGHGKLDTKAVPPRADVELTAPTIQLDDFKLGDWSPEKKQAAAPAKKKSKEELRKQADETQHMLSREVLQRQNAYLAVRVGQVMSGKDLLGSGKLEARLENGRAEIGPVVVNTPGGAAMMRMGYEPGEKDVAMNLRIEAKKFDYGILARRYDPTSEMRGVFSLDVDVNARAPNLSDLLRYGKGNIDFAVWPENMKSGLLDIWAVNVLMALLPAVDASDESKVNCAIGRFAVNDGKLTEKKILIDTSRMRVTGKGGVDFATQEINLYVQPRAKTPQFLSFALPIELSGTLDDFHVGVRAADVVGMVGQLVTSVVWVPLQSLFGKETPEDGRDVCGAGEFERK
jgi:uncharacterized protein involved in outer membrane biogenesis